MLDEHRLDGNAAGGILGELLAPEATSLALRCASCGNTRELGAVHVYDRAPGTVLRCPGCSAVLMRVADLGDRVVADLRGVALLSWRREA